MTDFRSLKVGDTFLSVTSRSNYRKPIMHNMVVVKVGRTYFYGQIKGETYSAYVRPVCFDRVSGIAKDEPYDRKAYLSEKNYADATARFIAENEAGALMRSFHLKLSRLSESELSSLRVLLNKANDLPPREGIEK
jgi:hypothetical protein